MFLKPGARKIDKCNLVAPTGRDRTLQNSSARFHCALSRVLGRLVGPPAATGFAGSKPRGVLPRVGTLR